jgi:hypothetical protein
MDIDIHYVDEMNLACAEDWGAQLRQVRGQEVNALEQADMFEARRRIQLYLKLLKRLNLVAHPRRLALAVFGLESFRASPMLANPVQLRLCLYR